MMEYKYELIITRNKIHSDVELFRLNLQKSARKYVVIEAAAYTSMDLRFLLMFQIEKKKILHIYPLQMGF